MGTPCHTAHFININHSAFFAGTLGYQLTSCFSTWNAKQLQKCNLFSGWLKWFNSSQCCSWKHLHPSSALNTIICPGFNITTQIIEVHYEKNVQEDQGLISKMYLEKDVTELFLQQNSSSKLNKGVTLWPNECAVQSSNGPPFKNSMKNTSVLSAFNTKGHKCLMADLTSVVYTCCHFFPLRRDKSLH